MKQKISDKALWHIIAILIIAVWGTTFISTKVLINHGLAPSEIFLLRFSIAYLGILLFGSRKIFADSFLDEFRMMVLGVVGGTIYFWTENTALKFSQANNVSFLVCTSPLWTSLLAIALGKLKMNRWLGAGTLCALLGMALVVFNGQFVLKLSPLGDGLAIAAAMSWAVYSLVMGTVSKRYSSVFITRKVFFYGLVGVIPIMLANGWTAPQGVLTEVPVVLNILFLGVVASLLCFVGWNKAIAKIGVVASSNYIYLNPIFTLTGSLAILSEKVTLISVAGSAFILLGVWLAGKSDKA